MSMGYSTFFARRTGIRKSSLSIVLGMERNRSKRGVVFLKNRLEKKREAEALVEFLFDARQTGWGVIRVRDTGVDGVSLTG
jgi:hypothetical protein